jgi:parvulin-like peptidyl-prolyl isomerase
MRRDAAGKRETPKEVHMRTRASALTAVAIIAICAVILGCLFAGCSKEKAKETAKAPAGEKSVAQQAQQAAQAQAAQNAAEGSTQATPEPAKAVEPAPPGTVRASHILVSYKGVPQTSATRSKAEALKLAQDLLARAKKGEAFDALAKQYSDCPSAKDGGDLGFFRQGQMVPPFDQAAFSLKPGQMSGIVETQFGYHIIKRVQ